MNKTVNERNNFLFMQFSNLLDLLQDDMRNATGQEKDIWTERTAELVESIMELLKQQPDIKRPISIESIRETLALSKFHDIDNDHVS